MDAILNWQNTFAVEMVDIVVLAGLGGGVYLLCMNDEQRTQRREDACYVWCSVWFSFKHCRRTLGDRVQDIVTSFKLS